MRVVAALLKAGADPNATDNSSRTPLYWANEGGLDEVVTTLLEARADPNVQYN